MSLGCLYYRIYKGIDVAYDYVLWALSMIENGCEDELIYELASFERESNYFEVKEFYRVVSTHIGLETPDELSAVISEGARLCSNYTDFDDVLDLAREMYLLWVESEHKAVFKEWYWFSEDMDGLNYNNTPQEIDYLELRRRIVEEAKRFREVHEELI